MGKNIASGKGMQVSTDAFKKNMTSVFGVVKRDQPTAFFEPGLPVSVGISYKLFGANHTGYRVMQVFISAFSLWGIFWIGSRLGGYKLGLYSLIVAVFYPSFIFFTGSYTSQTVFMAVLMITIVVYFKWEDNPTVLRALLLGLLWGLAFLNRTAMLAILPFICILMMWSPLVNEKDWRKKIM